MTRKTSDGFLASTGQLLSFCGQKFPAIIEAAGRRATRRFVEFFTAEIENPNTRKAYAYAVSEFLTWCEARELALENLEPVVIAAYLEHLAKRPVQPQCKGRKPKRPLSKPSIKQHLAAIRMLFDYLVVGQILPMNPAGSVRGPKYRVEKGKTPVLSPEDTRLLLDSIDTSTLLGLRDRALIKMRGGSSRVDHLNDYHVLLCATADFLIWLWIVFDNEPISTIPILVSSNVLLFDLEMTISF